MNHPGKIHISNDFSVDDFTKKSTYCLHSSRPLQVVRDSCWVFVQRFPSQSEITFGCARFFGVMDGVIASSPRPRGRAVKGRTGALNWGDIFRIAVISAEVRPGCCDLSVVYWTTQCIQSFDCVGIKERNLGARRLNFELPPTNHFCCTANKYHLFDKHIICSVLFPNYHIVVFTFSSLVNRPHNDLAA